MQVPYGYLTQRDINAIENVQIRAARFFHNNYSWYASVTQMLSNLNWPTLSRTEGYSNYVIQDCESPNQYKH